MLIVKRDSLTGRRYLELLNNDDIPDGEIGIEKLAFTPATGQDIIDAVMVADGPLCYFAATSNVTLSGTPTVDASGTQPTDFLLAVGQTLGADNGPWVLNAGAWSRPPDWAPYVGQKIVVSKGVFYAGTVWMCVDIQAVDGDISSIVWRRIDRRIITHSISASYTIDRHSGEIYIGVTNVPGGGLTITLPLSADYKGGRVTVVDEGKTASAGSPIRVSRAGADSVDGGTLVSLTGAKLSMVLHPDGGTNWYTLS